MGEGVCAFVCVEEGVAHFFSFLVVLGFLAFGVRWIGRSSECRFGEEVCAERCIVVRQVHEIWAPCGENPGCSTNLWMLDAGCVVGDARGSGT